MGYTSELSNAILVKDSSVKSILDSNLMVFLRERDFHIWKISSLPACNWIYISLSNKLYMPGIPGVGIVPAFGGHAVTVDDFMEIYGIFNEYEGLEILCMSREEEIIKKMSAKVSLVKRSEYFRDLSYERYLSLCRKHVVKCVGKEEPDRYIDAFMKHEEEMFKKDFQNQIYPEARCHEIMLLYDRYDGTMEKTQSGMDNCLESVDLVSQSMNVRLEVTDAMTHKEDKQCYQFHFTAEEKKGAQCINIVLDGLTYLAEIGELFLALDSETSKTEQQAVYSWGCLEFMPWEDECRHLSLFVYTDEIPSEEEPAKRCNYFCIELAENEIEKFKSFLFDLYLKIDTRK